MGQSLPLCDGLHAGLDLGGSLKKNRVRSFVYCFYEKLLLDTPPCPLFQEQLFSV